VYPIKQDNIPGNNLSNEQFALILNHSLQFQERLIIHNGTMEVLINRPTVAIKHVKCAVKLRIYLYTFAHTRVYSFHPSFYDL
jgi:hypothetical protein